jgi:hypothetical protein
VADQCRDIDPQGWLDEVEVLTEGFPAFKRNSSVESALFDVFDATKHANDAVSLCTVRARCERERAVPNDDGGHPVPQ